MKSSQSPASRSFHRFSPTKRLATIAVPVLVAALAIFAYQDTLKRNSSLAFDLGSPGSNTFFYSTASFDKSFGTGSRSVDDWNFGSQGSWSSSGDGKLTHSGSTQSADFDTDFARLNAAPQLNMGVTVGFVAGADNMPSIGIRCGLDQPDPQRMMLIVANGSLVITQHTAGSGLNHSPKAVVKLPFALKTGTQYTIEFNSSNVTAANGVVSTVYAGIVYATSSSRPSSALISYTDPDASLAAGTVCLGANGTPTNGFSYVGPLKLYTIGQPLLAGIGFIGDSITLGATGTTTPVKEVAKQLRARGIDDSAMLLLNHARYGTSIYDWNPDAALLQYAIKTFRQSGVTEASLMLGTNDALNDYTADQYAESFTKTMDALLAPSTGIRKVVINFSPSFLSPAKNRDALNGRLLEYQKKLLALPTHNGQVVIGDQTAYAYFQQHPELMGPDGIHPNDAGYIELGDSWVSSLAGN